MKCSAKLTYHLFGLTQVKWIILTRGQLLLKIELCVLMKPLHATCVFTQMGMIGFDRNNFKCDQEGDINGLDKLDNKSGTGSSICNDRRLSSEIFTFISRQD